ncbi:alpha/beta hydrolase [Nocardia sp. NBC_00565]|uniref:alpha/beta hydrolase n=1 Tax=Nocardia sp. NBC_00565 TaxID=2975993 RepID=UPI002E80D36B|nr:alpha/beta hydrolase [Nocardia sp. NBC_00565]WUC05187.1 alpha/beta hydrolase [Nocardia sp. NBC_00565]
MPLKPEARVIVDLAAASFPALGTEVLDAAQARRILAARPAAPVDPIPVERVEERWVPGPPGAPQVRVRVYRPAGTELPVVVFCHGGGFVICGLDSHDQLCRAMSNGVGAIVVSVDYRQAPEHRFPAAAEDAYAVLEWVAAQARTFGGDPERIAVAGDSSGGNLAAVTALMARDRNGPAIVHQLLVYPMLDPARDTESYRDNANGYFVTDDHLRWYWEQYLGSDGDAANPYAVPSRATDLSGLPPAYVITAEFDPLRDEGEEYGARLRAAGVQTVVVRYDGEFHGFFSMADHLPDAKEATAQAFSALRRALEFR